MKKIFATVVLFALLLSTAIGQSSAVNGDLMVYTPQGWIMKAKNSGENYITFRFTWVTEGHNQADEVVSTITEESQMLSLNPNEERQLFTAPQDPQKKITYYFKNILITQCITKSAADISRDRMNSRMRGGK